MPECDFNKVVEPLIIFFWKFAVYFQNTFVELPADCC